MWSQILVTAVGAAPPAWLTYLAARDNALRKLERIGNIRKSVDFGTNSRIAADQVYESEMLSWWKSTSPALKQINAMAWYFFFLVVISVGFSIWFTYQVEEHGKTYLADRISSLDLMAPIFLLLTAVCLALKLVAERYLEHRFQLLKTDFPTHYGPPDWTDMKEGRAHIKRVKNARKKLRESRPKQGGKFLNTFRRASQSKNQHEAR